MKIRKLLKEIKGVFKPPKKRYYLGKIAYYTPYFLPINFNPNIINIRKLKLKSPEKLKEYQERYPHLKNTPQSMFSNIPMVRRAKDKIIKLFNNYYFIEVGWPIMFHQVELGWKWKFDSIRYEWSPSFQIYFFKWQFVILWNAPDGDNDKYYEQILWWLKSSNKDVDVARNTWGWVDYKTKESTWNDNYLEWEYRDIDLGL